MFNVFIVLRVYLLEDVVQLVECLSIMYTNDSKEYSPPKGSTRLIDCLELCDCGELECCIQFVGT